MSTQPTPPSIHRPPIEIAPETFLIQSTNGEGHAPIFVNVNSLVIRGAEPIIIDTGGRDNRTNWLDDVFSLVDPADVRWITLSHDDADHTGNLDVALDLCPNATFVSSWFMAERMSVGLVVAPQRMRWLVDGDTLDIGDRQLSLVRPPLFDSPVTRGVFDPTTGVYWASDSFATPMTDYVDNVRDIDSDFWPHGFAMFAQAVSPWLELVDPGKFAQTVQRIADLDPTVIAGCHTPVIGVDRVDAALELMFQILDAPKIPLPDQAVLDEIVRAMTADTTA